MDAAKNLPAERLQFLDGLRGIAILLVVGYHAFARWPVVLPYGDQYGSIVVFEQGLLGVELFFLISGFVILMSLQSSPTVLNFLFKRWVRLFPVMFFASVVVFASAGIFQERPWGVPQWSDLLPGLTFIEPSWWSKVLGLEVRAVEGAFWSLFVEFKFYVIAGTLYFLIGQKKLVAALFLMFTSTVLASTGGTYLDYPIFTVAGNLANHLSWQYFGWFAAGSALFVHFQSREKLWLFLGVGMAFASSVNNDYPVGALVIAVVFTLSVTNSRFRKPLENRVVLFFGFISYPLYLIHENALVSMTIKVATLFPWLPGFFMPILPFLLLTGASYLIAKYVDGRIKNWLLAAGTVVGGATKNGKLPIWWCKAT